MSLNQYKGTNTTKLIAVGIKGINSVNYVKKSKNYPVNKKNLTIEEVRLNIFNNRDIINFKLILK